MIQWSAYPQREVRFNEEETMLVPCAPGVAEYAQVVADGPLLSAVGLVRWDAAVRELADLMTLMEWLMAAK